MVLHQLLFATHNAHKVEEIQAGIGDLLRVISLKEAGIEQEIPEPHDSLQENASEKSGTIHRMTGLDCFSEDTGLEVDALGGAPGAYSARYAGEGNSFEKNIDLLLQNMEGEKNRNARFRTVISLILDKKEYFFEGICKGEILKERRGNRGFGYDPVFRPEGSELSFGGMGLEEKNKYSHRKKAVDQMIRFIQSNYK